MLQKEQSAHDQEEKYRTSLNVLHDTVVQLEQRVTELVELEQSVRSVLFSTVCICHTDIVPLLGQHDLTH